MIPYHQTQSRNTSLTVGAAVGTLPTTGQVQVQINGNNNYKSLTGIMLLIFDADGNPYAKKAMVSVATTSGIPILPEQPYACIRPSFAEKPNDRIIPVENVAGFGHDFRFQVSIPNSGASPATFEITAVCFFTNR